MFILLRLSALYATFGNIPWVYAMFDGLKPAVMTIVILELIKIGKKSLHSPFHFLLPGGAFICMFFLNIPFPYIIIGALVLAFVTRKIFPQLFKQTTVARNKQDLIDYCLDTVALNDEYNRYLKDVNRIANYDNLTKMDFVVLCGNQPIEEPYFLTGISGVPSDSKYTTGCVLFVLKNCVDAFDALQKSVNLGGDVDSVASICTGIMAGLDGLGSIPQFMIDNVEAKQYLLNVA